MRLVWVQVRGYKRLEQPTKIDLDNKLIAFIGPNEAGKTSILSALLHINSDTPFSRTGVSQELTRGVEIPPNQTAVEASFLLEKPDISALPVFPTSEQVRWLDVLCYPDGSRRYRLRPRPKRDIAARQELRRALAEIGAEEERSTEFAAYSELLSPQSIPPLLESLDSQDDNLPEEVLDSFNSILAALEAVNTEKDAGLKEGLLARIRELLAKEETGSPAAQALSILKERVPQLLLFSPEDRDLQPSYDIGATSSPPPALANLARLAQLDITPLSNAISEGDHPTAETLVQAANRVLKHVFKEAWSQSGVSVYLKGDGSVLHVLVEGDNNLYSSIAERSDGLRHFVALLAFVTQRDTTGVKPILLIDEVEAHLHYDAQADLVQMLARQEIASKVIYTTHSIGSLPEDLGTGVRTVEPAKKLPDRSTVNNWFWEAEGLGFSPLLFGIGASTLAFIPIRKALFAEGPADFILLPSLFREAVGTETLGFQVVPGLSTIGRDHIPLIPSQAARVAYLVDSDEGGASIEAKLKSSGVLSRSIFRLPDRDSLGLVLEDFIRIELLIAAVNELLQRRYASKHQVQPNELAGPNRPRLLKEWCVAKGIEPPSRRAIAYQVLERRHESTLLEVGRRPSFTSLYRRIAESLDIRIK